MPSNASAAPRGQTLWYALFILAVVVLAVAGYAGYALYPRFNLPAASGIGMLVLAVGAGIASFFSPCSFSLLATLLARESGARPGQHASVGHALRIAAALAVGAACFLILSGVVIALGGSALFAGVTFTSTAGRTIRLIVGLVLILLGIIQLGVLPLSFLGASGLVTPLLRRQARLRRKHPMPAFGLYGFAYLLAGFG